jgi:hypothetical protein
VYLTNESNRSEPIPALCWRNSSIMCPMRGMTPEDDLQPTDIIFDISEVTQAQVGACRSSLMERLSFEPFTDPGFRREPAKLAQMISESHEVSARVVSILSRLSGLSAVLWQSRSRLDGISDRITGLYDRWQAEPRPQLHTLNESRGMSDEIVHRFLDVHSAWNQISVKAMGATVLAT